MHGTNNQHHKPTHRYQNCNTILNHVDTRVTLPKYEDLIIDTQMVYKKKTTRVQHWFKPECPRRLVGITN